MHPLYVCLLGRKGEMEKPGEVCEQPEAGHEDGARGRVRPDPTVGSIYIYGGSKNLRWFKDIQVIGTEDWDWQMVKVCSGRDTTGTGRW